MEDIKTAKNSNIHRLVICHTCHNRIKVEEPYTLWENSIYCEPCFESYLELIEPKDWIQKTR